MARLAFTGGAGFFIHNGKREVDTSVPNLPNPPLFS